MSRYRPPSPPKSRYITEQGFAAMQEEHKALWVRRKEVTKALAEAAAEGDRSENAEYIYRKKELRGIDRRIHYLQVRLPIMKVVHQYPTTCDQVFFGAWVTLEEKEDKNVTYRLVGADEFDPDKNWISIDSPMAKALLKKQLDDDVKVNTPEGEVTYCITHIRYPN